MNKLYENVGGKLKAVAKITAVILAVACAAGGLILLGQRLGGIEYVGLAIAVVGPFISWLISLPLYAFGETVEKLGKIERNTRLQNTNPTEMPAPTPTPAPQSNTVTDAPRSASAPAVDRDITVELGAVLRSSNNCVKIVKVYDGSAAALAGLRESDQIVMINGSMIEGLGYIKYIINNKIRRGQTVPFVILRDGVKLTVNVTF